MSNLIKSVEFKTVQFNGVDILAVKGSDGKIYVSIKKICEDLGLSHQGQLRRIKRNDSLTDSLIIMALPSNGGIQNVSCLDINSLPFFFIGIVTEKCKPEIRPYLLDFQLKAKDILAKAFINPEPETIVNQPKSLSEALFLAVKIAEEEEKNRLLINH
jgi:anti-repressor protein